jgi:hypothetical protein
MGTHRALASAGTTRTTGTPATARAARTAARATATATARTTRTTTTARPTTPTSTVAPLAGTTTTPVGRFTLHGLRPRHEVDQIKELTALLRAYRCRIALNHAHQANLGRTAADDIQGFHQPRQAIALHLKSSTHRLGLGTCSEIHRLGRSSFHGSTLGSSRLCRGRVLGRHSFSRVIRRRSCNIDRGAFRRAFAFRRSFRRAFRRSFRWFGGAGVLLRWRRRLGRGFSLGLLRVLGSESLLGLCCPPQHDSGELSDGLHGGVPFLAM